MNKKILPFKEFGNYYRPTADQFLKYYQDDLRRIVLSLLSKKNLRLAPDKLEDFLQELNLKITLRKEKSTKPSRLERFDPFRNYKRKKKIEETNTLNYITDTALKLSISFKTYLYTIVNSYVLNKAKQESLLNKRGNVSIDEKEEDLQLYIQSDSFKRFFEKTRSSSIQQYLDGFEKYLSDYCIKVDQSEMTLTVWNCLKLSTKNKDVVNLLKKKYPARKIKGDFVTRQYRKIRNLAQKFQEDTGKFEL